MGAVKATIKATITLSQNEEGDMVLGFSNGQELRFDSSGSNPSGVTFLAFYEDGEEGVYWNIDEVREDPELVLGAFFGKLCAVIKAAGGE